MLRREGFICGERLMASAPRSPPLGRRGAGVVRVLQWPIPGDDASDLQCDLAPLFSAVNDSCNLPALIYTQGPVISGSKE